MPIFSDADDLPLVIHPTDPDVGLAGEPAFRFVGPRADLHEELFSIDPSTGILRLKGRVDRENAQGHLLTIDISDRGEPKSLTSDALVRVRVRVLDENDSPPRFEEDANPTVSRVMLPSYAGAAIAQFRAIDPDLNDMVR